MVFLAAQIEFLPEANATTLDTLSEVDFPHFDVVYQFTPRAH